MRRRCCCNPPLLMHNSHPNIQDDPLSQFVRFCCEVGSECKEGKTNFFEEFQAWSSVNSFPTPTITDVAAQMKGKGFKEHRTKTKRFWLGLRLQTQEPEGITLSETTSIAVERHPIAAYPFEDLPCYSLIRRRMGIV